MTKSQGFGFCMKPCMPGMGVRILLKLRTPFQNSKESSHVLAFV